MGDKPGFTLTWDDPAAQVLIDAGTHGGRITDRGFFDDGVSLMEQVDKWRSRQREAVDG